MRGTRIALVGAAAVLTVAGCGQGAPTPGTFARDESFVGKLPLSTASPTVFVAGLPTTETLPGGQRVRLLVGGPALANPVKGQPVQFAPNLLETFSVTATLVSGSAVTFTPADFTVHRAVGGDTPVSGPAGITVTPGKSRTWSVTSLQTPGQGELVWQSDGRAIAKWSFVAEND